MSVVAIKVGIAYIQHKELDQRVSFCAWNSLLHLPVTEHGSDIKAGTFLGVMGLSNRLVEPSLGYTTV